MRPTQFPTPEAARAFTLAGRAVLTLQSERTGQHFTYQVNKADGGGDVWFVSLKNGPEQFSYLGVLDNRGVRATRKTKVDPTAPSFQAFVWWWTRTSAGRPAPGCIARHEGRCGRCHRALTHPESLDLGIGPECASRMGIAA